MNRKLLPLISALSLSLAFCAGCSTKKYVRNQTAPLIDKTNELDDLTAKNTRDIRDTDARAQKGIQDVQAKATEADQKALVAGKTADEAQGVALQAKNRVTSLANTVANLDNYRPVVETTVHFGFDKANLTSKAKQALDELGGDIPSAKHYIIVVDGNTDSTGPTDYNYQLSQRRASAVIQYLAEKYEVPAHKIYVIGLGKDKPVASNASTTGRAQNRRVDVRLMTNISDSQTATNAPTGGAQ
ncbi:MAG TPA: OmpA family protein [Terriglobales bacterium]|nr:OmpA family protein [Terriglobales bacterium]